MAWPLEQTMVQKVFLKHVSFPTNDQNNYLNEDHNWLHPYSKRTFAPRIILQSLYH